MSSFGSKNTQSGFTIIELMLATTVFSVIILIAALTLIQVGRMFHKGNVDNQTQEVLRTALTNITDAIQYGQGAIDTSVANTVCIGDTRYSYRLNNKVVTGAVNTANNETRYALVSDSISGPCTAVNQTRLQNGTAATDPPILLTTPRELLGPNMSLLEFSVAPTSPVSSLYTVRIKIAYGDSDLRPGNVCVSLRAGGAFCSVAELETTVQKRTVR